MNTFVFFVTFAFCVEVGFGQGNAYCYTPSGDTGYCVLLPQCPSLIQMYGENQRNRGAINYLVRSRENCGNRVYNREPIVCCSRPEYNNYYPTPTTTTTTTTTQAPVRNNVGEFCLTPDQNVGSCAFFDRCQLLVEIYRNNPSSQQVNNYLLESQRSCGNTVIDGDPIVCCGTRKSETTTSTTTTESWYTEPPTTPRTTGVPSPTSQTKTGQTTPNFDVNKLCLSPEGQPGDCRSIRDCPKLFERIPTESASQEFISYIQHSNVICAGKSEHVCCIAEIKENPLLALTPEPRPHLLSIQEGCGFSNFSTKRVVGGEPAPKGSYPWIVLLGYADSAGDIDWKCGGTLISSKHVLTAAHCVRSTLSIVRLGEHNIKQPSADIMDIPIAKTVKHPFYDPKKYHNDVAVIHLAEKVTFSAFVRPICLPFEEPLRSKNFLGYMPFVAGWGRTGENSPKATVLQHVQIPVLDNAVCKDRYSKARRLVADDQFDEAVLCAGVLSGGMDSCGGDSGGPLMSPLQTGGVIHWYQIGVVSYGIGCARNELPGVYGRVQTFVGWITLQVEGIYSQ